MSRRASARTPFFANRADAGKRLAQELAASPLFRFPEPPRILALPRGGIPVATEIARAQDAPLDLLVVQKIGVPGQREWGLGAFSEGGDLWLDRSQVTRLGMSPHELEVVLARSRDELTVRRRFYRSRIPRTNVRSRPVLLVDDGLATGGTARAAALELRRLGVSHLALAVPVAAPHAIRSLASVFDSLVCLASPFAFQWVGEFYQDFHPIGDVELSELLSELPAILPQGRRADLLLPSAEPRGVVLFVPGTGSSRRSPRARAVAEPLRAAGLACTLLEMPIENDSEVQTQAVLDAIAWIQGPGHPFRDLPLGLYGASTGAAWVLRAAAKSPVSAIVCRGGRTDLARDSLRRIHAPTLLIAGGEDPWIVHLNRQALNELPAARLSIIVSATHLFEEPGALESVAAQTRSWFERELLGTPSQSESTAA